MRKRRIILAFALLLTVVTNQHCHSLFATTSAYNYPTSVITICEVDDDVIDIHT